MKKTLAVAAVLAAFAGSAAADVTVYGKVDLGLFYKNVDGVETLKMESGAGGNTSRIGFKGSEKIGDLEVGFCYETGLSADDGTANKTFNNRDSHVYVKGAYGELGLGYYGVLDASTGPYSISGKISAAGTGWGGDLLAQDVVVATDTRWGNAITYVSPKFAGAKFYAQVATKAEADTAEAFGHKLAADGKTVEHTYSAAVKADRAGNEYSHDADMYYGVGVDYAAGNFGAVLVASSVQWKNATAVTQDASMNIVGGVNYNFGAFTGYLGANYYENGKEGHEQYGVVVSAKGAVAGGTGFFSAGYGEVTELDAKKVEVKTEKMYAGVGYQYPLSKQSFLYAATTWKRTDAGETEDQVEATFGLVHNF